MARTRSVFAGDFVLDARRRALGGDECNSPLGCSRAVYIRRKTVVMDLERGQQRGKVQISTMCAHEDLLVSRRRNAVAIFSPCCLCKAIFRPCLSARRTLFNQSFSFRLREGSMGRWLFAP